MSGTIKVAYLCEFPTLLGGERSLLTFLRRRRTVGVQAIVVAPPSGPLAEALRAEGIELLPWPPEGRHAAVQLAAALAKHRPDLVHGNSLKTAEAAGRLAVALGRPAVAHVRDIMGLSKRQVQRLGQLQSLIAVSDAVAGWLRSVGLPGDRLVRLYNPVDVAWLVRQARPGTLRGQLALGPSVPLIGCVGQMALRKGQDLFLAAAARLAARFAQARFLIVGRRYSAKAESREYDSRLRAAADQHPLSGRCQFLGYRHDVPSILTDLDVLVVPSRQEPLSRVLLEALALGVPAVATAVGGTAEILAAGRCGLLVPPDSPAALADAVARLLTDSHLRQRLREAGPPRVRQLCCPQRYARMLRALYERLLGRHLAGRPTTAGPQP